MAPKDDNSKNQAPLYLTPVVSFEEQQQGAEDCRSFGSSNNSSTSQNEKHPRGWKYRLVVQLKRLLGEDRNENEEDEDSNRTQQQQQQQLTKWGSTAIMAITIFSVYRLAKSRRVKQRLWPYVLCLFQKPDYHSAVQVSLGLLRSAAVQGMVRRALIGSNEIVFLENEWKRSKLPPNSPNLQSDLLELLERHGCSDVSSLPDSVWSKLSGPLLTALPFIYLGLVYKIFKNLHDGGNDNGHSQLVDVNSNSNGGRTRFTDVAGLDDVLMDVQDICQYLQNPNDYLQLGAHPPRGILLHGPPGSGKTLLAQALAGEGNCDAFITCSGSDFCEMYVGRGASRVRSLFERARSTALRKHQPGVSSWLPWNYRNSSSSSNATKRQRPPTAIIFIDELDALAKSRSMGGGATSNDERDQTLNQLLTEMDGFPSCQEEVTIIVIAATNRADVLDPAILRRFDRQIHVPYPDRHGRKEILKIHARKIHCPMDNVNWDHLASPDMTGQFSGSDLRNVVNDAALLAVRDRSSCVQQSHLLHAIRRARAMKINTSMGSNTLWSLSSNNNIIHS
eukprot:scaffold1073_cov98-Cylindrotheca_fusiformis.AAC.2